MKNPYPAANHPLLTLRNKQIIKGVMDGLTNKQIGDRLGITSAMVANDLSDIYRILDISNRTQLAVLVSNEGWVPAPAEEPSANT